MFHFQANRFTNPKTTQKSNHKYVYYQLTVTLSVKTILTITRDFSH